VPQSFACLHHHLIFSTKTRAPLITEDLQVRLYPYVGGILRENGSCLVAAGGMPDHVHSLVDLSRELSVSVALRLIKSNSSKWIHETFPEHKDFAWQTGYGAFAVSYSNLDKVKSYLASQAEHHRKTSFKEEFLGFLKRHKIEYDERYLWE
jgi:REP element-mobilizing transposase RayT